MAAIIKDSYNETNRFTKVVYQRGKDVMPWEMNEAQDNVRVPLYRAVQHGVGTEALNPGSNDDGWKVIGTGASNQVTVSVGWLFCDGIPLGNDSSFTQSGFSTYGGIGSRTDVVYLAVTETEVADPSLEPLVQETTRRRQIQVTVGISETGLAGVPSNTSAEIFEGGTHYFPIASIDRPTGQAAINVNDVTDLRYLLPAAVIAQIVRQEDHVVQALAATVIETPGIGSNVLPEANTMVVDVDPADSFSGGGTVTVRFNRDATPEAPFVVRETDGTVLGNIGSATTLRLRDGNVASGAAATLQEVVAVTSAGSEGNCLRVGEQSPPVLGGSAPSLIHAVNARGCITVGDGSVSFGDFNGTDGIQQALSYVAAFNGGAGVSVRIFVKRGAYEVTDGSVITIDTGHEVILDGEAGAGGEPTQSQVSISNYRTGADDGMIEVPNGKLVLRNVNLVGISGAPYAIKVTDGSPVVVERCNFVHQGIYCEGSNLSNLCNGPHLLVTESSFLWLFSAGDVVVVEQGNGAECAGYVFRDCRIYMFADDYPIMTVRAKTGITDPTIISGVLFDRCLLNLGSSAALAAGFSGLTNNCGALRLDPNGSAGLLELADVTWRQCDVRTFGSSGNSVLMYLRTQTNGTDYVQVGTVTIDGGRWQCENGVATNVTPFYVGGETAESVGHVRHVIVRDVAWGFGPFSGSALPTGNGAMATELGTPSAPSAFYIRADESVTLHNVRWIQCTQNADVGDLTVYRPKHVDFDGVHLSKWVAGGSGSLPDYRVHLEGYASGTTLADFVGSTGSIRNLVLDGLSLGANAACGVCLVQVLPNGRLFFHGLDIRNFSTGSPIGLYLAPALGTISYLNSWGLEVTSSYFLNVIGDAIHFTHDGTVNKTGGSRCIFRGNTFRGCTRGIYFEDTVVAASDMNTIATNTFERQTGLAVEINVAGVNSWTVMGNMFAYNNGGGLTSVQAKFTAVGSLMGNTCAEDDNRIQLPSPSAWRGAVTGYSGFTTSLDLTNATYTDSTSMLYNHAKLKTP